MLVRPTIGWVCCKCLSRRGLTTSAQHLPPPPPPSGAAKLTNRRLLILHGHDAAHFLQGLTTQNIRPNLTNGFYSAFLTATGRVVNDVFIYPFANSRGQTSSLPSGLPQDEPGFVVEVDASEASTLLRHLKRYKLRAKVNIQALEPDLWNVWSVWNEQEPWTPHPPPSSSNPATPVSDADSWLSCVDVRAPGMGRRLIVQSTLPPPLALDGAEIAETTLQAYTIRRMLKGVAEGQDEIKRDHALPQESNMDFMAGIDFRKGCYVGQELTIRTHHIGVVRKRILPAMLYEATSPQPDKLMYDPNGSIDIQPPDGTNIVPAEKRGRSAGKWIGGVGNIGLALCRIEMMTDMVLTGEGSRWNPDDEFKLSWGEEDTEKRELKIKAFVPDWVRSKTRVKTPTQQV